jgi:hypothetical protein
LGDKSDINAQGLSSEAVIEEKKEETAFALKNYKIGQ